MGSEEPPSSSALPGDRAFASVPRAWALLEMRRPGDAAREAGDAVARDPQDAEARMALAVALLAGRRAAEAVREAEESVHLAPDSPRALWTLGVAHGQSGNAAQAQRLLADVRRLDPENPSVLIDLSWSHSLAGNWLAMAAAARAALALDPEEPKAWLNLGIAHGCEGRTREAWNEIRRSLRLDPESPIAHFALGQLHVRGGSWRAAAAAFREALTLDPGELSWERELVGAVKASFVQGASRYLLHLPKQWGLPRIAYATAVGSPRRRLLRRLRVAVVTCLFVGIFIAVWTVQIENRRFEFHPARGLRAWPLWAPLCLVPLYGIFLDPLVEWWMLHRIRAGRLPGASRSR
ncbi:MAG: tetratricopeptide repeat protein [Planctomycetales bacterium]|nr:tetratricopeptide repeat protein [Planctomycetales bacterium]